MADAQLRVDYLDNGRGGFYLVHNGFKFSVKTRRNNRCYWRCVDRQCPATVTTLSDVLVSYKHQHNHGSDILGITAEAFICGVKKRCREEVGPIPSIYDEELGNLRDRECDDAVLEVISKIPTFESCKAALYRNRAKVLPKLPSTQGDIDLQGNWTETLAGDTFLLCDDTDEQGHRIMVFGTDSNLRHLCDSSHVLGDGTFYSCTGLFGQLYTLHGYVGSDFFPLVFALLPNKTERTYRRLLSSVKDIVHQRLNSVLTPETVIIDFEVAARNAFHSVFPLATLRGCFFHFTQSIWRRTQACGLSIRYREDEEIQRLVRRAAVLPLVPPHQVDDVWLTALEDIEDIVTPEITRFTDYVTETWVEGDVQHWNHFHNDGPRTTNHVEGWHSRLNKICQRPHPNIFAMVKLLQREQATNEAKMIQLSTGGKQRPKKRKYRQLDARLQVLKERLRGGQLTLTRYADAASHLLHLD